MRGYSGTLLDCANTSQWSGKIWMDTKTAVNCTTFNCTGGEADMEESIFTGPLVTGISVGSILLIIIMLSICYAKKWFCFMVSGIVGHTYIIQIHTYNIHIRHTILYNIMSII